MKEFMTTHFMLSLRFIVGVKSILGLLHCVEEGDVFDVSEGPSAFIIGVEVCTVDELLCTCKIKFRNTTGEGQVGGDYYLV
jgi:hypothetical protein